MKRISFFVASVALFFGVMGMAVAQETVSTTSEETVSEEIANSRRYEVGTFADNWFLGIGGGLNQYLGEHDRVMEFKHRLAPAAEIYAGKWFTPVIGFRFGYRGLSANGLTNQNFGLSNSTGEVYEDAKNGENWLEVQKFGFYNIHADFMLNLVNLIGGYKERVYNLSAYFGVGLARSYSTKAVDAYHLANTRISGSVGLLSTFRLCPALDLNVDVRGTLFPEDFDGETGKRVGGGETYEADGMLTASIGIAYKFKPRGWSQGKNRTIYKTNTVTVVDQDALNEALAQKKALEEELANAKAQTKTEVVESLLSPELYIVFPFNKSDLSGEARVTLTNLANLLNAVDTKIVYKISGYADQQTGSVESNLKLSQERAQAVYDFLVNELGVAPEKLTMEAVGGVDTMFYDDNRLSRAVILTLQK